MKHFRLTLYILVFSAVFPALPFSDGFTSTGSAWLGGGLLFGSLGDDFDSRLTRLTLLPVLRYFPADYFFAGPRLNWTREADSHSRQNQFGLGAEGGLALGTPGSGVVYLGAGWQADFLSIHFSSSTVSTPEDNFKFGQALPLFAGLVIPLKGALALQGEAGLEWHWMDGDVSNVISVSLGFAGLTPGLLLSMLQGAGLLQL